MTAAEREYGIITISPVSVIERESPDEWTICGIQKRRLVKNSPTRNPQTQRRARSRVEASCRSGMDRGVSDVTRASSRRAESQLRSEGLSHGAVRGASGRQASVAHPTITAGIPSRIKSQRHEARPAHVAAERR